MLTGLVLSIESSFLLNPILKTSHDPHFKNVLPCGHPCHIWHLGFGTHCEPALKSTQMLILVIKAMR